MRGMILWGLLLLANLAVAIGVVYVKHSNQVVFKQIQEQRHAYHRLQTEWGRLLLEQGTLAAYARVEQEAVRRLRMQRPDPSKVNLLSP